MSPEQMRKKAESREHAMHHLHNSAVDGPHHDTPMADVMYMHKMHEKHEEK